MTQQQYLIGFKATDTPGIVNQIADAIEQYHGNWRTSQMSHLAGVFSGLISIDIAPKQADSLASALNKLTAIDIIHFEETSTRNITQAHHSLDLIGPDRKGIIKEISQALAQYNFNIEAMETAIQHAPMSGEALFSAEISFNANTQDLDQIATRLDAIANDLTLDINLHAAST